MSRMLYMYIRALDYANNTLLVLSGVNCNFTLCSFTTSLVNLLGWKVLVLVYCFLLEMESLICFENNGQENDKHRNIAFWSEVD